MANGAHESEPPTVEPGESKTALGCVHAELDVGSFRLIAYLLQPFWLRASMIALPVVAMGFAYWTMRNLVAAFLGAIIGMMVARLLRHTLLEYEVRAWEQRTQGFAQRFQIFQRGFRAQEAMVPWSDVSTAAEINNPKAGFSLLAVRAQGQLSIFPSHGFVEGTFRQAREVIETVVPIRTIRLG